ncbi:MAG: hypothetical protein KJ955_07530 [Nanoarchaeota archaeon]|nr:hypothetical protein [Nanoarchaeota archaeon]
MSIELIQQNAKTLLEAVYAYEIAVKEKDKKKIVVLQNYAKALIASIRSEMGAQK